MRPAYPARRYDGRPLTSTESGKNWGCDVRSHVVSDDVEEVD
jgi:hypothetical protein